MDRIFRYGILNDLLSFYWFKLYISAIITNINCSVWAYIFFKGCMYSPAFGLCLLQAYVPLRRTTKRERPHKENVCSHAEPTHNKKEPLWKSKENLL